jgi:uncharacterized membrane protein
VLGYAYDARNSSVSRTGAKWVDGILTDLSTPDFPLEISGDGSTILIYDADYRPSIWKGGTATPLPGLPKSEKCNAEDMSQDGKVVIGDCTVNDQRRPTRWTNSQPEELAPPPEKLLDQPSFFFYGTSWSGTAATGEAANSAGILSTIWDVKHGLRWASLVVEEAGLDTDADRFTPVDISDDGKTIAGSTFYADRLRAFIARLP